jgi:phosphoribosylamine---glycine ligase
MRVLVVGSGGREHAICWALASSLLLTKLWRRPGNPGIAAIAETVPTGPFDLPALTAFARANATDHASQRSWRPNRRNHGQGSNPANRPQR